ncbi:hypothetical protein S7711_05446 [Stachybotrys chartarum IBT 7711]|uniref:Rhodopsin domain-containing protein n=1 Tax=Stachybotrys chartarum (strain CBS 109288 / IBT 7711) TaxID=1280523 RepID=A0A084BAW5_STACB|nr:hypothetical protein S7711_05446 [Stachybotrys chartarum IBT 7711]KFA52445.1 hypothetical protein S40293_08840 [Stachybotrys chartarum IBT 40293]
MSASPTRDPDTWPPGFEEENQGYGILGFTIVMTVVTVLAIVGRFWSRTLPATEAGQHGRFWWDDWMAFAAMPLILARHGLVFYMLQLGMGFHAVTLPQSSLNIMQILIFANYILYSAALFFTRASALFILSRAFPHFTNPLWFNAAIYVIHGLNTAWLMSLCLSHMFTCFPGAVTEGVVDHCIPGAAVWIGNAVSSVFLDLCILLLPLPKIWSLQINSRKKTAITIVFALGYIAIIVSIGRVITVSLATPEEMRDSTYGYVNTLYWLIAEAPIMLLGVCLPAMLHLARQLRRTYLAPLPERFRAFVKSTRRGTRSDSLSGRAERFSTPKMTSEHFGGGTHVTKSASRMMNTELESLDSRLEILAGPNKSEYDVTTLMGEHDEEDPVRGRDSRIASKDAIDREL